MNSFSATFLNLDALGTVWPLLWSGLVTSVMLILLIIPGAICLGLCLAIAQNLGGRLVRLCVMTYIDFFRSFPPLVLLIFLYSGLPFAGLNLDEFETVVVGLVLNGGAFFGEIFRAGIEAVPVGQREAARSTGLNPLQVMVWVVLPQGARNVAPPLASNLIELSKATSLAAAVALPDLLNSARQAQDIVYNPTPLLAAALIYLALLWPLVRLLSRLELRAVIAK